MLYCVVIGQSHVHSTQSVQASALKDASGRAGAGAMHGGAGTNPGRVRSDGKSAQARLRRSVLHDQASAWSSPRAFIHSNPE